MKHVIITGTSRGIGFELAQLFANKGHKVLAISRNTKPLSTIKNKNITILSADVANKEDLNSATCRKNSINTT